MQNWNKQEGDENQTSLEQACFNNHYLKEGVGNILICGFWYTGCMRCIEMLGLHWVWFVCLCMHSILCILCRSDPTKERENLETCDPQGAIVETCDLWDIWLESTCDLINQPTYLPIFMNTHLHYNPFTSLRGVIQETFIRAMRRYGLINQRTMTKLWLVTLLKM